VPFSSFDFDLLRSPEFKEDAVREELISPLLKHLGYAASGPNRIIRSKALTHPFVFIGTKSHQVKIIPDYVLEVQGTIRWILDTKAPREVIRTGSNVEQAFSYAIHPEVRAFIYALCNGHELVVYKMNHIEPILAIEMREIGKHWNDVQATLSPLAFTNPAVLKFLPDYGLYCRKIGVSTSVAHCFYGLGLPFIARVNDNLYSAVLNIKSGDEWYVLSLDFGRDVYWQLLQVVSPRFEIGRAHV